MNNSLDIQFLNALIHNSNSLSLLDKEVSVNDFSNELYYKIYLEILDSFINNKQPSYANLKLIFREDKQLLKIVDTLEQNINIPTDTDLVYSALCEQSKLKQLKEIGNYLNSAHSSSDSIVQNVENKLFKIVSNNSINAYTMSDIESDYMADLKSKIDKYRIYKNIEQVIDLPTGFSKLDVLTLGLQRANTWVIGGGSSDGKTEMAVQIANNTVMNGRQVLYFMLEDDKQKLITRFFALNSGISITKIMVGNISDTEFEKIKHISSNLKQGNRLLIEDETRDINDIIIKIKFIKLKYSKLDLIIIDHINLISDRSMIGNNREREISSASNKLVAIAKKLNISILILQQLNTNPDDRKKGLPVILNDLRDCKAVGHDASVVLLLNCPDKYNEEKNFSKKYTQIVLAKNRYGEVNKIIDLTNHAHINKFVEN